MRVCLSGLFRNESHATFNDDFTGDKTVGNGGVAIGDGRFCSSLFTGAVVGPDAHAQRHAQRQQPACGGNHL